MSSTTKIKLGVLFLVFLLLGGKLLGDTVRLWGDPKGGIRNLPCACVFSPNEVPSSNEFRLGVNVKDGIEEGVRLTTPSSMRDCMAVITMSNTIIQAAVLDGDVVIDGPTLVALRDNGVSSFAMRIVDAFGYYMELKFVLTIGSSSYQILIR